LGAREFRVIVIRLLFTNGGALLSLTPKFWNFEVELQENIRRYNSYVELQENIE
jgi:hypothetical protein